MEALAAHKLDSMAGLDLSSLGPEWKGRFNQSRLFLQWLALRIARHSDMLLTSLREARAWNDELAKHLALIVEMDPSAELTPKLSFVKTYFASGLNFPGKLQYMLEKPDRFEILSSLQPDCGTHIFRDFASDKVTSANHERFLKAASVFAKSTSLSKLIKNPVLKSLVGDLAAMYACLPSQDVDQGRALCNHIFLEVQAEVAFVEFRIGRNCWECCGVPWRRHGEIDA